ncbi:MAG TPA: SHOCT domain-containing protein [Dehalococcoidia bacterium]|nr:SHOCT domain-containing protein [Dehalococcoidia bacterium]
MGPWMMGGWNGGWGWMGGGISMVIFWVLLIAGVVILVRWIADSGPARYGRPRSEESAEDILKRRYASGEITKAEFDQARRDLA